MKKIVFLWLLFLLFNQSSFATDLKATLAGKLPIGVSDYLDNISTGMVGNMVVQEKCQNLKRDVVLNNNFKSAEKTVEFNLKPQFRDTAMRYIKNSVEQKVKAFDLAYKNKSCEDVSNLKIISTAFGF